MSTLENPIITGWRARVITARIWGSILRVALSRYSPIPTTLAFRHPPSSVSWPGSWTGFSPRAGIAEVCRL